MTGEHKCWFSVRRLRACIEITDTCSFDHRGIEQGKGPHEDVAEHTAHLTTIVNTTFFGLAGSSLRLVSLLLE